MRLDPVDVKYFKLAVGESAIKHSSDTDIQCRCPICGDSKKSKSKARLHLYLRNGESRVNCFNECAVHNRTMYGFLRDYYPSLLPNYRQETFKDRMEELKLDSMDLLGDFALPDPIQATETPKVLFDLSKYLDRSDKAYDYVESRGLEWDPSLGSIYLAKDNLTIDGKFYPIKDYLIIPFYCNGKMFGFYSRSLTEHRFYTYMPSGNTDWKMWNYFNVDMSKTIYIFEGIFDALAAYNSGITNVIACCGATPPLDRLKDMDIVLCLDNDQTGKKNAVKFLKQGYKCLCYNDIAQKDMNDILKAGIDVENLILNNVVEGIMGIVKIQNAL